ncbi:hypothetical protein CVP04_07500 [Caviibacterium pharyngocola]|uniref:Uncharacterized protein n=1 Tax=Caviibacterium pharyngocola TaxID=28159 RepID=A0A2M8RVA7_9PAST|nr:hypothetical protein CVP04_07500 [Caviibacterium pharyngocola]
MKLEILKHLNAPGNDSSTARAEFVEWLVKQVYDFVKFERPGGEGDDGRNGMERRSLAKVRDATIDHKFNMMETSLSK